MEEKSIFATVLMGSSNEKNSLDGMTGTHFSVVPDPMNEKNNVLQVWAKNTNFESISATNIAAEIGAADATTCELEMKLFFEEVSWAYSTAYFDVDFQSESGARKMLIRFEVQNLGGNVNNKFLVLKNEADSIIDGAILEAEKWHKLKFEYYPSSELTDSRLKIYVGKDNSCPVLVADVSCPSKAGSISKAVFYHHATKIRGKMYLDDISFAITAKKYLEGDFYSEISTKFKKIYDFENGIPSNLKFNIRMKLNKSNKFFSFDPSATDANVELLESKEYYNIIHILDGGCVIHTENDSYEISDGHIAIIPPRHSFALATDSEYKLLLITGSFDELLVLDDVTIVQDNIYGEGEKIAQLISYNRFSNSKYFEALCNSYVAFISIKVDMPPFENTTAAVYKIIEEMEKRFDSVDLTVGNILAESGYAINYIREKFIEVVGMPPLKYLTRIRMKHARALLTQYDNNMSISEVAYRCGMLDLTSFSRMFKKYYGVSPLKYKSSRKSD